MKDGCDRVAESLNLARELAPVPTVTVLLENAIAYTPEGSVLVRVTSAPAIEVTDTGRGIAIDNQRAVLEPFVTGSASRARADGGGLGLGLAIANASARAMGAELRVHSDVGAGSTFTLVLPPP